MPAQRTKDKLDWDPTCFADEPRGVTVGSTLTMSNDDMPPLVDPPMNSNVFVLENPNERPAPTKRGGSHAKKKDDGHIPRPPNAFLLFRSSFIKGHTVPSDAENSHSNLSVIAGIRWNDLSDEERNEWTLKAKAASEEHKRKFPDWSYKPQTAGNPKPKGRGRGRRKVQESLTADDKRCQKIADLLKQGKTGDELGAAVQEYDRDNKPQIIARFQEPITARSFRRSSSVPPGPVAEFHSKSSTCSQSPSPSPVPSPSSEPARRKRSSSVQPVSHTQSEEPPSFERRSSLRDNPAYSNLFSALAYPPYPQQPQPQRPHATIDFSSFSFQNRSSPVEAQTYDPLSPAESTISYTSSLPDESPISPQECGSPYPWDQWDFSSQSPLTPNSPYEFNYANFPVDPSFQTVPPEPVQYPTSPPYYDLSYRAPTSLPPQQNAVMAGGDGGGTSYGGVDVSYGNPEFFQLDPDLLAYATKLIQSL